MYIFNKYDTCIRFLKKLLEDALQLKDDQKKKKKQPQAHSKLKTGLKKKKEKGRESWDQAKTKLNGNHSFLAPAQPSSISTRVFHLFYKAKPKNHICSEVLLYSQVPLSNTSLPLTPECLLHYPNYSMHTKTWANNSELMYSSQRHNTTTLQKLLGSPPYGPASPDGTMVLWILETWQRTWQAKLSPWERQTVEEQSQAGRVWYGGRCYGGEPCWEGACSLGEVSGPSFARWAFEQRWRDWRREVCEYFWSRVQGRISGVRSWGQSLPGCWRNSKDQPGWRGISREKNDSRVCISNWKSGKMNCSHQ